MGVVFTPDKGGSGASPIAVAGGVWMLFGTLTFSGSYPTNGDPLNLKPFLPQLSTVKQVVPLNTLRGMSAEYINAATPLLKLFKAAVAEAPTEHAAAAYNAAMTATPIPVAFLCK